MVNKNKDRGSSFEREVSKKFASWLGGEWSRTPHSGAMVNHVSDDHKNVFSGDIIPPAHWKKIAIECKYTTQDFPFHRLLTNEKIAIMDKWLDQTLKMTDKNTIGLLVFKVARKGTFIALPHTKDCMYPSNVFYPYNYYWSVLPLDMMIENNTPGSFEKYIDNMIKSGLVIGLNTDK